MSGRSTLIGVAASAAGVALLLAGCSGAGGAGSAAGDTTTASTTKAASSAAAAPSSATVASEPESAEATTATPAPAKQPAGASIWNPCALPDSALAAAGLDTGSKEKVAALDGSGALTCKWKSVGNTLELHIVSSTATEADLKATGNYVNFVPTSIGLRSGVQYRAAQDTSKLGCYHSTATQYGLVTFTVKTLKVQTDAFNSCNDVGNIAAALVDQLPE
ncbi:DUF3558 family protein [Nocardia sp. NPDC127579]|uniref:DUF3558 family protein n=1 Tax=Nocardia sp. NPDC127579 TaxID=3345402 RepID=UPI00363D8591